MGNAVKHFVAEVAQTFGSLHGMAESLRDFRYETPRKPLGKILNGVGCWVLGIGYWGLGIGCWVWGVGCWVLGEGGWGCGGVGSRG